VESGLKTLCGQRVFLVGAGGKFNVLSRLANRFTGPGGPRTAVTQAGSNTSLSLDRLQVVIECCGAQREAERLLSPGDYVRRADRILTEAVIVEAIMQRFDFQSCTSASWGLRHGALLAPCAAPASTSTLNRQASDQYMTFVGPVTRPNSGVVQLA